MKRERVVVFEGMDERDLPLREPAPETELTFAGTGPARGEYEAATEVEYLRPTRRAA